MTVFAVTHFLPSEHQTYGHFQGKKGNGRALFRFASPPQPTLLSDSDCCILRTTYVTAVKLRTYSDFHPVVTAVFHTATKKYRTGTSNYLGVLSTTSL